TSKVVQEINAGQVKSAKIIDKDQRIELTLTNVVYRVAREALTNVLRHAPGARSVTVAVEEGAGCVTVEVADDAPAAPARHPHRGGYGLIGMRERVESLGGSLSAGPRPGGGWSVSATLPVPTREP
ncbi:ATP-binding protein, partial [Actinomadura luteofluorescens]